jgi:excisionase family DNA binding protein
MLLTTKEVAERIGVNFRTVARYAESGKLKPKQKLSGLRGAYLFERATVERFISESMTDKPRYVGSGRK